MATDKEVNVVAKFVNQLPNGLSTASKQIHTFATNAKKEVNGLFEKLSSPQNLMKGLVGGAIGAAIFQAGKNVIELDTRMQDLRISGNLSAKEMFEFKENILSTSLATGAANTEITELAKASLVSSHNVKFVSTELGFMTKVMQASGISGSELGDVLGDIQKDSGLLGTEFETMIAKLFSSGRKLGAEQSFKKMLPNMPQMVRTIKTLMPNAGMEQIRSYITAGMFMPNPAMFDKSMRMAASNLKNKAVLRALHLSPDVVSKLGFNDIITAIKKATPVVSEQMGLMRTIFGKGSFDLKLMTDDFEKFQDALKTADVKDLFGAASEKSDTMASSMERLKTAALLIADSALAPVLGDIAKGIKNMSKEDIEAIATAFKGLGKVLELALVPFQGWAKALVAFKYGLKKLAAWQVEQEMKPKEPRTQKEFDEQYAREQAADQGQIGDTPANRAKMAQEIAAMKSQTFATKTTNIELATETIVIKQKLKADTGNQLINPKKQD